MIVIAGKNNIAVRAVDFLKKNNFTDVVVIPNKTDVGINTWQQSLLKYARSNCVPVISIEQAYSEADFFISLEFDSLINPNNFKKAKPFNIHFSDLPRYKGMYTSIWPILNSDNYGGVTLHEIDTGIDTGSIVSKRLFPIKSSYRARDLYREFLNNSYLLFINNISNILNNTFSSTPQAWINSTYYSRNSINFLNLELNLNATAHQIQRQIYGYSFREYQIPHIYNKRIVEAEVLDSRSLKKPGTLISDDGDSIIVSSIDYNVRLFLDKIFLINRFAECSVSEAAKLLKNLAGINDRNQKGWSPLIVAAYNGNHKVVNFLLDSGAILDDENYNGTSVLMYAKDFALKTRDKTTFDELLRRGADVNKIDFNGKKLIEYISVSDSNFLGV